MSFAFLFPGQGSQSVGMLDSFSNDPVVTETFSEASELLGQDMWALAHAGPEDELAQTVNTQPLMLISDIAIYRSWVGRGGPRPRVLAGHSLGEYAALVVSGSLQFADAVPLVRLRARLMQDAVPIGTGAMAAVLGLADEDIQVACNNAMAAGGVAEAANFNAPGQVVIAGDKATVERAVEEAKGLGAKRAMLLAMSAPSHCSLIKNAADEYAELLSDTTITEPGITVIHNEDVSEASTPGEIKLRLTRQLYRPVRWVETMQAIAKVGVMRGAECGPGKVLSGLSKRIDKSFDISSLASAESMDSCITEYQGTQS